MGLSLPAGFGTFSSAPSVLSAPAVSIPALAKRHSVSASALSGSGTGNNSAATINSAYPNWKATPAEEAVLKLLSDGFASHIVASTLGITESAISQHLAKDEFRAELAARKSVLLGKYKKLDNLYDEVELELLEKLKSSAFMFTRPGEITAALAKLNAMKRRLGASDNSPAAQATTIVNINMPTAIIHKFVTTQQGHIVGVDEKSLVTMPSNALAKLTEAALQITDAKEKENGSP